MISVFLSPGVRGVIVIKSCQKKIPLLEPADWPAQYEQVLLVLRSPVFRLIRQFVVCHHSLQHPGTAYMSPIARMCKLFWAAKFVSGIKALLRR